jgi:uncharacterized membrane protein YeaQ/YmgE (transglycosylase-associated protein family)
MQSKEETYRRNEDGSFAPDHMFEPQSKPGSQSMDTKNVLIALAMGLAAGWLASFVVGGGGLFQYLVSGVLGSYVGSFVLQKFNLNLGIKNEIGRDIATATIGAIIVMVVAYMLT